MPEQKRYWNANGWDEEIVDTKEKMMIPTTSRVLMDRQLRLTLHSL
jgi:hypothetical protein